MNSENVPESPACMLLIVCSIHIIIIKFYKINIYHASNEIHKFRTSLLNRLSAIIASERSCRLPS